MKNHKKIREIARELCRSSSTIEHFGSELTQKVNAEGTSDSFVCIIPKTGTI